MNLFSSFDIRKVHFKNRAVMAPMVLNCAGEDGSVTPAFSDFYAARARGGVGYIVLGATFVHNDGRGFGRQLGIDRDRRPAARPSGNPAEFQERRPTSGNL